MDKIDPIRSRHVLIPSFRPTVVLGFISIIVVRIMIGCAPSTGPLPDLDPATPFQGDWDDVPAAASAAAQSISAAVEESVVGERDAVFSLRLVGGGPARFEAVLLDDGRIEAKAHVGRFGDPEQEQRLVAAFAHRLKQLYAVDYAPKR